MRPIDSDKLRYSTEWCVDEAGFGAKFTVVHKEEIENAPTLDVEPVRRGEWVQFESETGWGDAFECSVCGGYDAYETRYCPNCGAKMKMEVGRYA